MRFTQAQKQLWLDQGYLVGDKLLEDAELDALGEAFLTTIDRLRRENRLENVKSDDAADDAKQVFQIRTAHLAHPLFEGLIRDTRLLDAIESLIGPNIRLVHFQGLYKPPHTGGNVDWHQDDYYFGVNKKDAVASCWLALDDATVDNGCMWVVPGAHRRMYDHQKNWDPKDKKGFFFSIKDEFLPGRRRQADRDQARPVPVPSRPDAASVARQYFLAHAARVRDALFRCHGTDPARPLPVDAA